MTSRINEYELTNILDEHSEGFLEFIKSEGGEVLIDTITITKLNDLYKLKKKQFKEFFEMYKCYLDDLGIPYDTTDLEEFINNR